jgi:hypothetical protein
MTLGTVSTSDLLRLPKTKRSEQHCFWTVVQFCPLTDEVPSIQNQVWSPDAHQALPASTDKHCTTDCSKLDSFVIPAVDQVLLELQLG